MPERDLRRKLFWLIAIRVGISTLLLADGTRPKGFLCEAEAIRSAKHISSYGGWRAFMADQI